MSSTDIKAQLQSQRAYLTLHNIIRVSQTLVLTLGLLGACFLAAYQVINNIRSPGDFVILLSYWAQLRGMSISKEYSLYMPLLNSVKGPLAIFSNLYKSLSESLMDAERMLELFQITPKITDKNDAKPLTLIKGEIIFKDVKFAYDDRKPALNGINLKIDGGSTVAIVGETGSGKSTTLKLLQRFYDVTSGSIEIDGQDIRDVTVKRFVSNENSVCQMLRQNHKADGF
jgi:ABC-type multidrug transport system fused ATPase/permease subunit